MKKLSIIIPVYCEEKTITALLDKILEVDLIEGIEKEVIVVDDASSDRTPEKVRDYIKVHPSSALKFLSNSENKGKGFSVRRGIQEASGEWVVVQDADLEYNPADLNNLLKLLSSGQADVVYGSRFVSSSPHRVLFFWHYVGNKFLTAFSNIFTNLNLSDMETCYKMFRTDMIRQINLKEDRFGFEPEVTAKIAKISGIRIYEVGISYYGRTYQEGKKIKWQDGLWALFCIIKYNLFPQS